MVEKISRYRWVSSPHCEGPALAWETEPNASLQVDGSWSYGKVFMVYEKRWFAAVITSVDHDARTLSVQYKGEASSPVCVKCRGLCR